MKIILLILPPMFLTALIVTAIYAIKLDSGGLGWLAFGLFLLTAWTTRDVLMTLTELNKSSEKEKKKEE